MHFGNYSSVLARYQLPMRRDALVMWLAAT
jgi:hypothetical protein